MQKPDIMNLVMMTPTKCCIVLQITIIAKKVIQNSITVCIVVIEITLYECTYTF